MLQSVNPHNNELIQSYTEHTSLDVARILNASRQCFTSYSRTNKHERSALLQKVSAILLDKIDTYAPLMALEMGKPILQSRAEIEKCAWVCRYYAENGPAFLEDEIVTTDAVKSYIAFQPLGIILAVMPWNFPFWQVFRFAAPTLMAGNTAVLKHASNVCGCALAIENIFREAGFPEDVFRTILVPGKQVAEIIAHPYIKAVSLTGSSNAGISVAAAAGRYLKKCVLELGGSDPYIILEDADIEAAADTCATARLINGGQSCIAAKRFIVHKNIYDEFVHLFAACMKSKKMGNPMDPANYLGPQARVDLRDELHMQTIKTIKEGAKVKVGGDILGVTGAYYPPTVLVDVEDTMTAFNEELFGPVAPVIKAENEAHAVELANKSVFGLGAAVFTRDIERGEIIAKEMINAGSCFVNSFVKSDPRLPFGGINESGYGRELSYPGIREFVNIKTIYIK
ncbi:MAG: NAD-dependent succinate-semialdehyde dehydrogenase [Ignavibacteriales bacterium]|nr:NAD-dependent succinate-semialdehyde dehydrogenase [Ignavibacteriales bacterium]